MQFKERDYEATAVPDSDLLSLESVITRLETFVRSTSAPDWCRVRAELASALEQTSQRRVPDSLRLRVWNLALESPQPTTMGVPASSAIERHPYNEPAPDDEADDVLFAAEPPSEQDVNSDALELVSPNRVVSGAELMIDTEELASTSEASEHLDGTGPRHAPLVSKSQQPQQPSRPGSASLGFMNCPADEAELDRSTTAAGAALMSDTFAVLEQDVMRTRRGLAAFERPATRARLTLWLCAFCDEHSVPYMQGMNEIAAVFVYLHETLHADATTCACYAMYKRFAERYVPLAVDPAEDPFGRLKQAFRLFNDLLWFHDPEVASRLERYQLSTDMYATAWLVTVFARNWLWRQCWLESDQALFAKDTPLELASPSLLRRLALYPCLKLQRKTGTFVRRYLGVSKRRLFVLAPDRGRNTTFLIKSSRSLVLLKRILFRKESRELVVFEFRSATSQAIDKRITCHLPDGLSECIDCIRSHLKLIKVQMRLQRRTTDRSDQERRDSA